ncbi:MAG: hypothetical protein AB1571_00540 [Nanoarchaeota archaeon]
MKHSIKITVILLSLFILAQIIGLVIVKNYISEPLPYKIEKPEIRETTSFIPLTFAILIATALALFLLYFRARRIWKFWFFISVLFCLLIAFGVFVNEKIALILAFVFSLLKVYKPNVILHNLTELFIYGGLAALFVPILNIFSISVLLVIISLYDMIAVWKTKYMVKMVKFQSKLKVFAGLLIPYGKDKTAILGGGDIGFPLLFSGTVLKTYGLQPALFSIIFTSLALLFLLLIAEKKKYYPAMPFLAAGCFISLLIINLI